MPEQLRPYAVAVPQEKLDSIAARLALAEVGYAPADDSSWNYGMDAGWLTSLLDHWRTRYDWRRCEAALNRLPLFEVRIEDLDIRFIHVKNGGFPIVLTHGWPGSILEFQDVIAPLSALGFDLIVPCLPGYGFSERPQMPIGPRRVARMWRTLMTEKLGYSRFGAQGGDWGSAVTTWLGRDHADVVWGIHLNLFTAPSDTRPDDDETRAYRAQLASVIQRESAYMMEHATKPQTIGLALASTPLGFAAWVCEKFHGWGDTEGDIESRFSKDWLLDNVMTYLTTDTVQSAIWTYRTILTEPRDGARVIVPTALALFAREFMPYPPRSAADRAYNVTRWTKFPSGGHFAAKEEPAAFAADVGAFFSQFS